MRVRDHFVATIRETLDSEGIEALVIPSQAGVYPPWVKLEAWLPQAADRLPAVQRAELEIVVDHKAYHRYSTVCTARLLRGARRLELAEREDFSTVDVKQWVLHALDRGATPTNYSPIADALVALVMSFIPFVEKPHHTPIADPYKNKWHISLIGGLSLASLALLVFGGGMLFNGDAPGGGLLLVLLGIAGFVVVAAIAMLRPVRVFVAARPVAEPRNLRLVDSWHTVIAGLGGDIDLLRDRIFGRLS